MADKPFGATDPGLRSHTMRSGVLAGCTAAIAIGACGGADSGGEAVRDGATFTSPLRPYFNNVDDLTVDVSFVVGCP